MCKSGWEIRRSLPNYGAVYPDGKSNISTPFWIIGAANACWVLVLSIIPANAQHDPHCNTSKETLKSTH